MKEEKKEKDIGDEFAEAALQLCVFMRRLASMGGDKSVIVIDQEGAKLYHCGMVATFNTPEAPADDAAGD